MTGYEFYEMRVIMITITIIIRITRNIYIYIEEIRSHLFTGMSKDQSILLYYFVQLSFCMYSVHKMCVKFIIRILIYFINSIFLFKYYFENVIQLSVFMKYELRFCLLLTCHWE